jgi:hypothetical protein
MPLAYGLRHRHDKVSDSRLGVEPMLSQDPRDTSLTAPSAASRGPRRARSKRRDVIGGWYGRSTTHIGAVFAKLGLAGSTDEHRRVAAVLIYLREG